MYIKVKVNTSSKREVIEEERPDHFTIGVKEPAKQNLANTRVRQIIADKFKVLISSVRIINGHHSPSKLIVVDIGDDFG